MRKNLDKKTASDVPSWNLSDLYARTDDPKIERDLKKSLRRAIKFERTYKGKINTRALTPKRLFGAIGELENIVEQASKPQQFAHLLFAADTGEKTGAFAQKIEEKGKEISKHLLFFDLELVQVSKKRIRVFLKAPELKRYAHFIKVVYSFKKHRLSEPEEKIIHEKDLTGASAFTRLFEELTSNAKFELVRNGKKEILNESQALALLHDSDRNLRKSAAASLTHGFKQQARLYTFIYNTLAQDKAVEDRLRNYSYPQEPRHMDNEISKKTVDTLVDVCVNNYGIVAEYYDLKKRMLGYKELFDYDRYAPISSDIKKISFSESKDIVLASFGRFSPRMKEVAEKFFANNWIDAQARHGKRGGAFCSYSTTDLHPYVFMNFLGKTRDVMTLGHELGHGVHAYLARPRGYFSFHSPLTLAETASVFGEMLVFDSLKSAVKTPQEKLALLCGKIEDIISTVFRQIAMYRFESDVHEQRRRSGELSTDALNALWLKNNQEMFGKSLALSEGYRYWWMYIPHFINTPFYVYAYPFGELLTFALYAAYQKEGTALSEKYLRLLAAGGSEEPAKILSEIGIDVAQRSFWQAGMGMVKEMVREARRLHQAITS